MARKQGPFARLIDHFHTHPRGRLHEILFWVGMGVLFGALALGGWRGGFVSPPIAWILGVVALCFVGWAFLPQHRPPPKAVPRPPKSKRK